MNVSDQTTSIRQQVWKNTMIQELLDEGYTHVLHLAFNRNDWTIPLGRRALSNLHAAVDRRLLTKSFHLLPGEQRTKAIFFFEGVGSCNLHVHSLWKVQPEHRQKFEKAIGFLKRSKIWTKMTTKGSHELDVLIEGSPDGDPARAINYAIKEQHVDSAADTIVWSAEFHR